MKYNQRYKIFYNGNIDEDGVPEIAFFKVYNEIIIYSRETNIIIIEKKNKFSRVEIGNGYTDFINYVKIVNSLAN